MADCNVRAIIGIHPWFGQAATALCGAVSEGAITQEIASQALAAMVDKATFVRPENPKVSPLDVADAEGSTLLGSGYIR